MSAPERVREEIKVSHTAAGKTSVTVVVESGSQKASWSQKCYSSSESIKGAVLQARMEALRVLDLLGELVADLDVAA